MDEERLKRIEDGNNGSVQPDRTIRDLCSKVRELQLQLSELRSAAQRVYDKYGKDSDWTEWTDLRDALAIKRVGGA